MAHDFAQTVQVQTRTHHGALARFGGRSNEVTRPRPGLWLRRAAPMPEERLRVDRQGEADEVRLAADVADELTASEPHRVAEVTVDRLGVVASREEPFVGIMSQVGWGEGSRRDSEPRTASMIASPMRSISGPRMGVDSESNPLVQVRMPAE